MPKTKKFDEDEFLIDLHAMSSTEVQKLCFEEISKDKLHLEKIEVMIKSGLVDVKAKDEYDRTPLHWACEKDAFGVAKLLLDKGADVDAINRSEHTPLYVACDKNAVKCAKLLIERGADVEAIDDEEGWSVLEIACQQNAHKIVKLLLEAGADPNMMSQGLTALHSACRENALECAKLLLEAGADPEAEDYYVGESPIDMCETPEMWALLKKYMK